MCIRDRFYDSDFNNVDINLNPSNVLVNSLVFTRINTVKGSAVKINLTIHSSHDPLIRTNVQVYNEETGIYDESVVFVTRTVDFENTVVLRGDY